MSTALLDPADGITVGVDEKQPMRTLKAVWNGTGGSGRTSFLMTLLNGEFPVEYTPSVFDNYSANFTCAREGVSLSLGFWDVQGARDGDEEFDMRIRSLAMPATDILFLCVDCTRRSTLSDVEEKWLPQALKHASGAIHVLLILKTDLRDDPAVVAKLAQRGETVLSSEEAEEWGAKHGTPVIQVSAKRGDGMAQFIGKLVRMVLATATDAPKPRSRVARFFGKLFVRHK